MHKNEHLQAAFSKYGEAAFSIQIIESVAFDRLDERELYWIAQYRSSEREFGYNKNSGGQGQRIVTDETRQKMRVQRLGTKQGSRSEETKKRLRDAWKLRKARGWNMPASACAKISAIQIGRKASTETRARMSAAQKALSSEVKQRRLDSLRSALTGRVCSEETRRKISETNKRTGRTPDQLRKAQDARRAAGYSPWNHTPESIKKISDSKLGKRLSQEHRAALSRGHTGEVWTVERRANMSAAAKQWWFDRRLQNAA